MAVIGEIKGKNVLLVDDLTETAGTLTTGGGVAEEEGRQADYRLRFPRDFERHGHRKLEPAFMRCPLLAQQLHRRSAQQPHVESQRPAAHVGDVHVERLAEAGTRAGGYLPQPGQSLWHQEPLELVLLEVLELVGDARPRPHQRHLAAQHVDQLRQLVQRGLAQPVADRRDVVERSSLYSPLPPTAASSSWSRRCRRGGRCRRCSTRIVRNLSTVNSRMFMPSRVWRKNTGPGEERCTRHAMKPNSGASSTRPIAGSDDVDRALELAAPRCFGAAAAGRSAAGPPPCARRPAGRRARTAAGRCRPGRPSARSVRTTEVVWASDPFEKATITRSTSRSRTICGQRGRALPSSSISLRSARRSLGASSTMPISRMRYSRCCCELAGDQLADVSSADDHGVLHVGRRPQADPPRERPAPGHEQDREHPEADQLARAGDTRCRDPAADEEQSTRPA